MMAALCIAQPVSALSIDSKGSTLDRPIAESPGSYLPQVCINIQRAFSKKRIRSFGDFQNLISDDTDSVNTSSSDDEGTFTATEVATSSLLDTVLIAEWEDRFEQGLFRYDVTACATKAVPGAYGFIAQLNEGRGSKKRPTEFKADKVCQEFDTARFNFTKIPQKEILFHLDETASTARFEHKAMMGQSPNLVLINVSPIEYGHVLLVPRVLDCLPQLVDTQSLLLALHFCQEAQNPYFRLCYNSLGAYGTVNHLHFQAYYLAAPFAVERAPTKALDKSFARHKDVEVALLSEYPVRCLVFEAGESLDAMARLVGEACVRLQRLFLFPNNYSRAKAAGTIPEDLLDTQVDPAAFEMAGHLILKRKEDYDAISQAWLWRLLSYASFSEDDFTKFVKLALGEDDRN